MEVSRALLLGLFWSFCPTLEQATEAPYFPVSMGTSTPLILSPVYMISTTGIGDVCPVLVPGSPSEFVIQGPQSNGQFLTSIDLEGTIFHGSYHRLRSCQGAIVGQCDHLVIRADSVDQVQIGAFTVRYISAEGVQLIVVNVLYGPPRVTYTGEFPTDMPIEMGIDDVLPFELHVMDQSPSFLVCENTDTEDMTFLPSSLLEPTSPFPRPVRSCLPPEPPSRVEIRLASSVSNPAVFAKRRIRLVLGTDCSTNIPFASSKELVVIGVNVTGDRPEPLETTTDFTTNEISTTAPSELDTDSLSAGAIAGIVIAVVVVVVGNVVLGVVLCFLCCRKSRVDDEMLDPPISLKTSTNSIPPQQNDSASFSVISILQDDPWAQDLEEELANTYEAEPIPCHNFFVAEDGSNNDARPPTRSCDPEQSIDCNILMKELNSEMFLFLCVVTDSSKNHTEPKPLVQIRQLLKSSPPSKRKVALVTFGSAQDRVDEYGWGIEIYRKVRGSGTDTAQIVYKKMESGNMDSRRESAEQATPPRELGSTERFIPAASGQCTDGAEECSSQASSTTHLVKGKSRPCTRKKAPENPLQSNSASQLLSTATSKKGPKKKAKSLPGRRKNKSNYKEELKDQLHSIVDKLDVQQESLDQLVRAKDEKELSDC